MLQISLVDYLVAIADGTYISNLRYLDCFAKLKLLHEIEKVPIDGCTLGEWNDALEYIAHQSPADTASDAKERLLAFLCT